MYLIGSLAGGVVAMMFWTWVLRGVMFKSLEPDSRAAWVIISIYSAMSTLAMFGGADGGWLWFGSWLLYAPGALLCWFFLRRKYRKLWNESNVDPDVFS